MLWPSGGAASASGARAVVVSVGHYERGALRLLPRSHGRQVGRAPNRLVPRIILDLDYARQHSGSTSDDRGTGR